MNLAESSRAGDVGRDAAVRRLAERAVLTRAMCRELTEATKGFSERRPLVAMGFLLRWIGENLPECLQFRAAAGNLCQREAKPSDGIDLMIVPRGCEGLIAEIRDGAAVGDALFMLFTADTMSQLRADEERIRDQLAIYWQRHGLPTRAPLAIESWSGLAAHAARGDAKESDRV
ncbi:MAG: hypothetical protein SFU86_07255 [Pirellulaceae bacterium]|nr:hypothetical protein [Pirellulaceae bacterium]